MKQLFPLGMLFLLFAQVTGCFAQSRYPVLSVSGNHDEIPNKLTSQYMPVIGVWVRTQEELQQDGYKLSIDQAGNHSPFNLLISFLRFPDREVVEEKVHDQVKLAAVYAVERNIALVADLDIRSARRAFSSKYPEELQQMLRIKEVLLTGSDFFEAVVSSLDLNDHYTDGKITHHVPLSASLLRVCSYQNTTEGIIQESIRDITTACKLVCLSKDSVKVRIPSGRTWRNDWILLYGLTLKENGMVLSREEMGLCLMNWQGSPMFGSTYASRSHRNKNPGRAWVSQKQKLSERSFRESN